ncbi:MAG: hypothetical protein M1826_007018 [Phylliscum demangeonii]|nr:MAG: hypothetical protein M1826_007018 [Phylliscum demangeonii]
MKLDTKHMRYLSGEDWRVLTAVEMGSRNHEIVPTSLISEIAGGRSGCGAPRNISVLAKIGLISRVKNAKYDGYRLTYGGLDYLALHTHQKRSVIYSVGNQIGVGKESDIVMVADATGTQYVLKIHRLGRISFRTVKTNRDYLRKRAAGSWMYMSRLAAMKEHACMAALHAHGFPVPRPVAHNRHTVLMQFIDAFPLRQISHVPDPAGLYAELILLILRLAQMGLIHADFNEFNILIKEEEHDETLTLVPVIIDFPQMVSIDHVNAQMYFDRDVNCIKRFFARRFHFASDRPGPSFAEARAQARPVRKSDGGKGGGGGGGGGGSKNGGNADDRPRLDVLVEASGFSKKMARELEGYMKEAGVDGDGNGTGGEEGMRRDEEEEEDDEEEEEEDDEDDEEEDEEDEEDEEQEKESDTARSEDGDGSSSKSIGGTAAAAAAEAEEQRRRQQQQQQHSEPAPTAADPASPDAMSSADILSPAISSLRLHDSALV